MVRVRAKDHPKITKRVVKAKVEKEVFMQLLVMFVTIVVSLVI